MAFALPPLPYEQSALSPHMSAETLEFHHGKHHRAYIDKTNELVEQQGLGGRSLVELVRIAREKQDAALFNNTAQAWNHSFFWQCLTPDRTRPSSDLMGLIERGFGSLEALVTRLHQEAVGHFASGWAWLVLAGGDLKVVSCHDADSPIVRDDIVPLLTLDVWEHAYYVDYRNDRAKFADAVLNNIINWDFASRNLDGLGAKRGDLEG